MQQFVSGGAAEPALCSSTSGLEIQYRNWQTDFPHRWVQQLPNTIQPPVAFYSHLEPTLYCKMRCCTSKSQKMLLPKRGDSLSMKLETSVGTRTLTGKHKERVSWRCSPSWSGASCLIAVMCVAGITMMLSKQGMRWWGMSSSQEQAWAKGWKCLFGSLVIGQ